MIASKYSLQAIALQAQPGAFRDEDVAMCVGCMVMIDACRRGPRFRYPVTIRDDSIFINSVWDLPKSVVDGSVASDLFVVSRKRPLSILKREIPKKDRKFVCDSGKGVRRADLNEEESAFPSITEDQVLELAEIGLRLEDYYGSPQDIEWAITSDGAFCLLQCRPLQQIEPEPRRAEKPETAGERRRGSLRARPRPALRRRGRCRNAGPAR